MAMAVNIFVYIYGQKTLESSEDIVIKEFGIKIEKFGKAVSVDNDIFISVFLQLPNISSIVDENRLGKLVRDTHAGCISNLYSENLGERKLAKTFKSTWEDLKIYYEERAKEFLQSRLEILSSFIVPLPATEDVDKFPARGHRNRRNIWSFLGNSALTLLMGGITEVQIYKINKHVTENRKAIKEIKKVIRYQQDEIRQLNEQVYGFMREMNRKMHYMFHKNICSTFYSVIATRIRHEFIDWITEIDNTLWTAMHGENSLLLTPRMLRLKMLKEIVSKKCRFKGYYIFSRTELPIFTR